MGSSLEKMGLALVELYCADSVALAVSDVSVDRVLSFNAGLIHVEVLSVQLPAGNPVEAFPEAPPPLPEELVVVHVLMDSLNVRFAVSVRVKLTVAFIGTFRIQSMRCEEESGKEPIRYVDGSVAQGQLLAVHGNAFLGLT